MVYVKMHNIYFSEYSYLSALLLMCLIWCIFSYVVYDKIKKTWLYLLFPTVLLSIPVIYYTIYSSEQTIYIVSLLVTYSYYAYKLFLRDSHSRINKTDTILIPLTLFIINMYIALTKTKGVCLLAP